MPTTYVCNMCGETKLAGNGTLPQGEARCQPCRRIAREASPVTRRCRRVNRTCPVCENGFGSYQRSSGTWTVTCSKACAQRLRNPIPRSECDRRTTRWQRECTTPGLTATQRTALLRQWIRQARVCTYCTSPCEAVDHVIPLWRGGTNHEGNLAPVCRRCNSSKGTWLLVEWPRARARRGWPQNSTA